MNFLSLAKVSNLCEAEAHIEGHDQSQDSQALDLTDNKQTRWGKKEDCEAFSLLDSLLRESGISHEEFFEKVGSLSMAPIYLFVPT